MSKRGGLGRLVTGMEREVAPSVFRAANLIEVEAVRLITTGAVSGKNHVPSRPGEAPNSNTHGLDRNIETTQPEPLRALVSSNARYAAALEFGTSKMAARPYMAPAAATKREEAAATIAKGVAAAVRKLGAA